MSYDLTVYVKWNGSLIRPYTGHNERRGTLPPNTKKSLNWWLSLKKKSSVVQMHVRFVVLSVNQHMLYYHQETVVKVLKFL